MELTKSAQKTNDLASAYDERQRLFDRLRNLNVDDETRSKYVSEYAAAATKFETLRTDLIKSAAKLDDKTGVN